MNLAPHSMMSNFLPMRRAGLAALAATAALGAAAAAQAQAQPTPVWYAGVHVGVSHLSGWPARVNFGSVAVDGRLALDDGTQAGLLLGRRSGAWRFELEARRGTLPIATAQLGAVTQAVNVEGRYRSLTVNALRVMPIAGHWNALAGVGLGMADVSLPAIALANGCHCFAAASDRAATVQARLGVEWQAAPGWRLQLAGGWLRLPGPSAASGTTSSHYERRGVLAADLGLLAEF
jgi:opacity protein-like surface antigen